MSEYCNVKTQFKDEDALVCALLDMGKWTIEQIQRHADPVNLIGYHNDVRPQRAHLVIRKQHVGSMSNDIGFERLPDGSFVAHISEFDKTHHKYNEDWMKQVKQHYVYHVTRQQQEARGRRVSREWLPGSRPGTRKQLITIEGYR